MILKDDIRDEKLQHYINRETANYQFYHQVKLIKINMLQVKK